MEYWKDGIMVKKKTQRELTRHSNIPTLHHPDQSWVYTSIPMFHRSILPHFSLLFEIFHLEFPLGG
jgi:hypothetical protein